SSRRRHTRSKRDWSSDVCSSDLDVLAHLPVGGEAHPGVAPGGGRQLLHRQLVKQFAPGGGLLGLGLVGGEAGDELLQLPDLLLRSEERRVGEGGPSRCSQDLYTA